MSLKSFLLLPPCAKDNHSSYTQFSEVVTKNTSSVHNEFTLNLPYSVIFLSEQQYCREAIGIDMTLCSKGCNLAGSSDPVCYSFVKDSGVLMNQSWR
ncbi:hypothetical protein llap_2563 [Limosa lapponica baueri]|uniref:Uncharacterized protein n=1 Tax=Limosa lapponica baueri TaxID=1758121 RepID=A0A2I0UM75_LIMLA|nr:hypothetical protein llap_2563 [Limosa lapponica baueri]